MDAAHTEHTECCRNELCSVIIADSLYFIKSATLCNQAFPDCNVIFENLTAESHKQTHINPVDLYLSIYWTVSLLSGLWAHCWQSSEK